MGLAVPTSADEVLRLAAHRHGDPAEVLTVVRTLLDREPLPPRMRALGLWAEGLALHELGLFDDAVDRFRASATFAVAEGEVDAEARTRANLAITLLQMGASDEAAHEMATARAVAPPSANGATTYLAALFEQRQGNHDAAFALYVEALPLLQEMGDQLNIGFLCINRGVLLAYRGELAGARKDFALAERIAEREGLLISSAMAAHNLGFTYGRQGFLPDALLALDRAEERYLRLGYASRQLPVLHSDRAEILLSAGLFADAQSSAREAVRELSAIGNFADLNEAQLLLARTSLAVGDLSGAMEQAATAARGFRAGKRHAWAFLALAVGLQAALSDVDRSRNGRRLLRRSERFAAQLAEHGWPLEGRDALAWAARIAVELGELNQAEDALRRARAIDVQGSAAHDANLWYAEAVLRAATGDRRGAQKAIRHGLTQMRASRDRLGGTEAYALATRFGHELAQLGVDLAVAAGAAGEALRCSDQNRAVSLRVLRD